MAERFPVALVYADLGATGRHLVAGAADLVMPAEVDGGVVAPERVAGVVVRSESRVDAAFVGRFPALAFVLRAGSGTDNIDLELLRERGITLIRSPDTSAGSVAEIAWLGLTSLARQLPRAAALLRRGSWRKQELVGESVAELVVTIWGGGPVGRAVADRLAGQCRLVRFAAWPTLDPGLPAVPADVALSTSDAHMLCLPLRPQTSGWFGPETLRQVERMRPYLINIGRFELIDFPAAAGLLQQGRLRGIFVDPVEPWHLPQLHAALAGGEEELNLMATPHLGAQRHDVLSRLAEWAVHTARTRLKEVRIA